MNKLAYSLTACATLLLASCASTGSHPAAAQPSKKHPAADPGCQFRYPMSQGCKDGGGYHDVTLWQNFLLQNGFLPPHGYQPGYFDLKTVQATKKFQLAYQLPPTGVVDIKTFQKAEDLGMPPCTPVNLPCPKH